MRCGCRGVGGVSGGPGDCDLGRLRSYARAFNAVTLLELFSKADARPRMLQKWARWTLTLEKSQVEETLAAGTCTQNSG